MCHTSALTAPLAAADLSATGAATVENAYTETIIDGGCHTGFGSYGAQKGDGAPVISAEEQQQQTADALAAWINLKS